MIVARGIKLKILLTVHQFFPDFFAGTEVLTLSVAKELSRLGHEVTIFCGFPDKRDLNERERFDSYSFEGLKVYRFHQSFVPMGGQDSIAHLEYDNPLANRFFNQLIKELNPEIIHFFHLSRLGSGLINVALAQSVKSYFTPTDFWTICPTSQLMLSDGTQCLGPSAHSGNCIVHLASETQKKNVAKFVSFLPLPLVDSIAYAAKSKLPVKLPFKAEIAASSKRLGIVTSRMNRLAGIFSPTAFMTQKLLSFGVSRSLISDLPYGLDVSQFPGSIRSTVKGKPLTFGFVGALAPHKGCHVLIQSFNRLKDASVKLKIYGALDESSQYLQRLVSLAANNSSIEFLGTFPNQDIATVMSRIDVLVVPSLWFENAPLVVHSALADKCPVIASSFPGITELIQDGLNGLLFEPGNSTMLVECLERLLAEPALLSRLSENCQPQDSIEHYVGHLLEAYGQA
jgi:glycosyltransferase involved in cell wall biosynthesis